MKILLCNILMYLMYHLSKLQELIRDIDIGYCEVSDEINFSVNFTNRVLSLNDVYLVIEMAYLG